MIDNDSSILSERQTPHKAANLQDQLQGCSPADWINDPFDLNISNPSLDLQRSQRNQKNVDDEKIESTEKVPQIQNQIVSQKQEQSVPTITIAGDTITSHTGGSSTLSSHGQGSNFKQYLFVNQSTYQPHIKAVSTLYEEVKQFSQKSKENLRMYYIFFKTKLTQEVSFYEDSKLNMKIENNQLYNDVYVNAKLALNELGQTKREQTQRGKKFIEILKCCHESLLNLIQIIQTERCQQQKGLEKHQQTLASLNKQIEVLITNRVQKQPTIHSDRYLQSKYVIQKQKEYLNGIYEFNRKVMKYMNSFLAEQEFQIWIAIKSALTHYCKGYTQCYPRTKRFSESSSKLFELQSQKELLQQMASFLQKAAANSLKPEIGSHQDAKNKLEEILIAINKEFEQTIYFPIIEIQDGLILYKSTVKWTATSKNIIGVDLVVSVDGFLHFEKQKDLATLKVKDLKISQKGNEIILIDKSGGMMQYIMKKPEVGKIQFDDKEDLDIFVKVILTFLKKL